MADNADDFLKECLDGEYEDDKILAYTISLSAVPMRENCGEQIVRGFISTELPTKEELHENLSLDGELPWEAFDQAIPAWISEESFSISQKRSIASLSFNVTIIREEEYVADHNITIVVTAVKESFLE